MIGFNEIEKFDRAEPSQFLKNDGQNKIGINLQKLIVAGGPLNDINDIARMWQYFMKKLKRDKDNKIKKFTRTSEEIVTSKIWSGCSDVGTVFATILRANNIPTIYLQGANIDWVNDLVLKNDKKNSVRGHIFLEIFLNDEWLLFDPTNGYIYPNYDFNNLSLPQKCYAFSKSLNGHEVGAINLDKNNEIMTNLFKKFDIKKYKNPNYKEIDLRSVIN